MIAVTLDNHVFSAELTIFNCMIFMIKDGLKACRTITSKNLLKDPVEKQKANGSNPKGSLCVVNPLILGLNTLILEPKIMPFKCSLILPGGVRNEQIKNSY